MAADLNSRFENIIMGKEKYEFGLLGFSLLFNRLNMKYEKDPTPQQLKLCVEEVNVFVKKYEKIITKDLEKLIK